MSLWQKVLDKALGVVSSVTLRPHVPLDPKEREVLAFRNQFPDMPPEQAGAFAALIRRGGRPGMTRAQELALREEDRRGLINTSLDVFERGGVLFDAGPDSPDAGFTRDLTQRKQLRVDADEILDIGTVEEGRVTKETLSSMEIPHGQLMRRPKKRSFSREERDIIFEDAEADRLRRLLGDTFPGVPKMVKPKK